MQDLHMSSFRNRRVTMKKLISSIIVAIISLNIALISILRKLGYRIEILHPRKTKENQFYYINSFWKDGQSWLDYDHTCTWSLFIKKYKGIFMNTNRFETFFDAILAIIITVLVLKLTLKKRIKI